jgi:hypothetical protein
MKEIWVPWVCLELKGFKFDLYALTVNSIFGGAGLSFVSLCEYTCTISNENYLLHKSDI